MQTTCCRIEFAALQTVIYVNGITSRCFVSRYSSISAESAQCTVLIVLLLLPFAIQSDRKHKPPANYHNAYSS